MAGPKLGAIALARILSMGGMRVREDKSGKGSLTAEHLPNANIGNGPDKILIFMRMDRGCYSVVSEFIW